MLNEVVRYDTMYEYMEEYFIYKGYKVESLPEKCKIKVEFKSEEEFKYEEVEDFQES